MSKSPENKPFSSLRDLGFSENESAVYLALAEAKEATANPLISKTGLHRALVYTALEHLVARKLVSEREVKGKKHFSLASPDVLVEEFVEKRRVAEEIASSIRERLSAESQEITVHQGNEEYLTLLASLVRSLPKGGTKYVLGTGGEGFMRETMRPIWKQYHRVAGEAGIKIKMVGYAPQRPSIEPDVSREAMYETRYLRDEVENPSGVHVYPEAKVVLNIIYSTRNQPVVAIKIKSEKLVAGYLNLFEALWERASA